MKTMINVKTDKELKKKAQAAAHELGLPLSTVITAYLKEFIRKREVTFFAEPKLRPETKKLLKSVERDIKSGRNFSRPLSTPQETDDYLSSL